MKGQLRQSRMLGGLMNVSGRDAMPNKTIWVTKARSGTEANREATDRALSSCDGWSEFNLQLGCSMQ